jgi:hypothetical protein
MATYYWVGGTGTWSATGNTQFAITSGGAPTILNPISTDTVIFDSASGTGTCTTASGAVCSSVTLNSSTLALTLGANLTMSGIFTLTLGILSLGSYTLTCQIFSSANTNTRVINFGTGNVTLTGNANSIWLFNTLAGFSFTGTPTVNCTYAGSTGTRTINHGGTSGGSEANSVSFYVTAGTDIVTSTNSISLSLRNFDFTGFAGTLSNSTRNIYGNYVLNGTMTCTAGANATTFAATSGTQQITTNGKTLDFPLTQNGVGGTVQLQDNLTMGSTRTFTLTAGDLHINNRTLSTGLFSSSNSNTRTIDFKSGNITVTGNNATVYTTSTATNLTILGTPVVNLTYSGSTGTRTITSSLNVGTFTSLPTFNISAGSDIVLFTNNSGTGCLSLNFTGFTGTCSSLPRSFVNNLTLVSGMTLTNLGNITFVGTSGTQQITTAGKTFDFAITFNGIGSTFAFQDALTQALTRNFIITNGTVQLKNGVTSTVGAFATSGTNQKFLQSTTPGSQATLSQASGTVNASYLTIRDINAVGGATWNAYVNQFNSDAGNVDGWDFGISPVVGGAEYTYSMRSFTQPRRF